jgi:hypothetical protein
MPRILTFICALIALSASVATASTPAAEGPLARVLDCEPAGTDREAVFFGRMAAIPGAARMSMKGAWEKVEVPELRPWRRSAPGVKVFTFKQRVKDLRAGGAYRALVQYRWLSAGGTLLRSSSRQTGACKGDLPNLEVGELDVRPGPTADTRLYRVGIRNSGDADALDFTLQLHVDRAVLDASDVSELAQGEDASVTFTGPPCENTVRAKVDAGNDVGEISELDNARSWPCPG